MDEKAYINVSEDKLSADITFSAPDEDGEKLEFEQVLRAIENARVTYGVQEETVKYIFENREYDKAYQIAQGYPPNNGIDGSIEYKYDFDAANTFKVDERGNIDYLNVERYISVKENDILAEYKPATKGLSGINVYGGVVPAKNGKNLRLPLGKNVKVLDDGVTIVSKIEGLLEFLAGKLTVSPVLYISGDVDISTGNIDFVGSVQIRGSIKSGMKVVAGGSVDVNGIVEAATIKADGNINLNGGVKGMGRAVIVAGESVTARYIENATIIAGKSVKSTFVLKSDIQSHDYVEIIGSKSSIIGGSVKAKNYIKCKNVGSANYISTELEVGFLPQFRKQMIQLEKDITTLKGEIINLSKVSNIPDYGLNAQQKEIKARLLKEQAEKNFRLSELENEYLSLKNSLETNDRSYISVENITNIGTTIIINTSKLIVKEPFKFTTFKELDDDIVISQYGQ